MSQIFDIVEELEKERKKNKELKKQLKLENEYSKYLPEGVEYILLTKATYDTQQNELQDQVFYLEEVIDKAIEYIENGSLFDGSFMVKKDLLDILEGSDK